MLQDYIQSAKNIIVYKDGEPTNIDNIQSELIDLFEGSYSTPSFVQVSQNDLSMSIQKGIWIEIEFENNITIGTTSVDKILFAIKPKYNFLTIVKFLDNKLITKCTCLNLSKNTNKIFDTINQK